MKKQNLILIQTDSSYIRASILREGKLSEFLAEDLHKPSQVGAIYKARVIQKKMDSYFVDLGQGLSAFLTNPATPRVKKATYRTTNDDADFLFPTNSLSKLKQKKPTFPSIRRGQHIMVQIIKDAFKSKNLRASQKISLPGANLVYLPQDSSHIGISRQIEDPIIREQLIQQIQKWKEPGGLIVRTKAGLTMEGEIKAKIKAISKKSYIKKKDPISEADPTNKVSAVIEASSIPMQNLKREAKHLKNLYLNILKNYRSKKGLGLIHSPPSFAERLIRDFLTEDIQQILISDKLIHQDTKNFLSTYIPEEKHKLKFYKRKTLSLFNKYDLELELAKLMEKKVHLPHGGFLFIEETEAAVVIDVNSGRFRGQKSTEENILKVNLLAAEEIARQLRLRNCGGIVLIDFIDMEKEKSQQKLMDKMAFLLKKDRAPTNLFPLSEINIAQITRKRERPSLRDVLLNPCPHCEGRGHIPKNP